MKENFNGECLSFGYAQAGQENPFTWKRMRKGLEYQFALFEKVQSEGKICVEKLGETGRWYKNTYSETPASAITAHGAYDDGDKNSVWYSSKNYRINLYSAENTVRVRDMHIFSENLADPFEDKICETNDAVYETLPVVDGNIFSGNGILSGVYFKRNDGSDFSFDEMEFIDLGNGIASVKFGDLTFILCESSVKISANCDFTAEHKIGKYDSKHLPSVTNITSDKITLSYSGTAYGLKLKSGEFISSTKIKSSNCEIEILIENR